MRVDSQRKNTANQSKGCHWNPLSAAIVWWFEWCLVIVCNLHHTGVVMYMPHMLHMIVEIKLPWFPGYLECQWTTLQGLNVPCSHVATLLLHNSSGIFHFVPLYNTCFTYAYQRLCIFTQVRQVLYNGNKCLLHCYCVSLFSNIWHTETVTVQQTETKQVQSYFNSRGKIQRLSSAAIHSQLHRIHLLMYSKCTDYGSNVHELPCQNYNSYVAIKWDRFLFFCNWHAESYSADVRWQGHTL